MLKTCPYSKLCGGCTYQGIEYSEQLKEKQLYLNKLLSLSPKKVVYISCNPETLARDLQYLSNKGYKAQIIQPIEMFPFTEHVECVVMMSRVKG